MPRESAIITLSSDFGAAESYVAEMKGVILSLAPGVTLVDGPHDLPAHDVAAGAYQLRNLSRAFPPGTIHLAVVDPGVGGPRRPVLVETESAYFVGPDNGLFTYVLVAASRFSARVLDRPELRRPEPSGTFHGRDIFAPAAAHLASGMAPSRFGAEIANPVLLPYEAPRLLPDGRLMVSVVHVDRFGNVILGLSRAEVAALAGPGREARPRLERGGQRVESFRSAYQGAPPGEPFFLWNGADDLEIALDRAPAAEHLGLRPGDRIRLDPGFVAAGSAPSD
jgi:S-adenosylmethionine hydrolase